MNLLFILNTFYPNIGGVESATLEICKRLLKKGNKVYVLSIAKSNFYPDNKKLPLFEKIAGIHIFRVRPTFRAWAMPLKAFSLIRKFKINRIYVTDFWGFIAILMKKLFQIPFTYVLNGYNPICPRGTLYHEHECQGFEAIKCLRACRQVSLRFFLSLIITRNLLREAYPTIAISRAIQKAFLSYFGQIPLKLLYYGVDKEKFRPNPARILPLPYNLKVDDKIILFFGRLISERGVGRLLNYFGESLSHSSYKLIIVGLGPEVSAIKNRISELKIGENVILTGPLRNEGLIRVINLSNVVILPILFPEPLSLVVMEAMACAKPIVSFNLGGVRELIEDGKTGYLVEPNDWEGFMKKIQILLENNELAISLGEAGRLKIEKYFNWEQFIEGFLKFLK